MHPSISILLFIWESITNVEVLYSTYHGGTNQQWRFAHINNDEFSIQNVATGTYAVAPGKS